MMPNFASICLCFVCDIVSFICGMALKEFFLSHLPCNISMLGTFIDFLHIKSEVQVNEVNCFVYLVY